VAQIPLGPWYEERSLVDLKRKATAEESAFYQKQLERWLDGRTANSVQGDMSAVVWEDGSVRLYHVYPKRKPPSLILRVLSHLVAGATPLPLRAEAYERFESLRIDGSRLTCVAFSPDGSMLAAGGNGCVPTAGYCEAWTGILCAPSGDNLPSHSGGQLPTGTAFPSLSPLTTGCYSRRG